MTTTPTEDNECDDDDYDNDVVWLTLLHLEEDIGRDQPWNSQLPSLFRFFIIIVIIVITIIDHPRSRGVGF